MRGERGFSLLEILVAFAILALSLGVILNILALASTSATLSGDYSRAATLAASLLDEAGRSIPLDQSVVRGELESGFQWELTMEPVDLAGITVDPPAAPYRVNVTILWHDGARARRLTLATLRLEPRQ